MRKLLLDLYNSREVRERNRECVSERSCLNYAGKGYIQHDATKMVARWRKGRSKNWSDAPDI